MVKLEAKIGVRAKVGIGVRVRVRFMVRALWSGLGLGLGPGPSQAPPAANPPLVGLPLIPRSIKTTVRVSSMIGRVLTLALI